MATSHDITNVMRQHRNIIVSLFCSHLRVRRQWKISSTSGIMGVSPLQAAKRALVVLLRLLAATYGIPLEVTRDSSETDVTKVTKAVEAFLLRRLQVLRTKCICASTTLQRELAAFGMVALEGSTIRRILARNGFQWLPRAQKRKYSPEVMQERLAFARAVLRLSKAQLREKLCLSMDGVVLSLPPKDAVDRVNYCTCGDTHMWRTKGEAASPELAGDDPYPAQLAAARAVPLWGGISEGGFAVVAFHSRKKFNTPQWVKVVHAGKLSKAIRALHPVKPHGPWKVLCDNETFLRTAASRAAHDECGVSMSWKMPAKSPYLNPVEKFWGWLRRQLRIKDLADLRAKRPPIGRTAFQARVRSLCATRKAQCVAMNIAAGFRKTCKEVVMKKGAMARG